MNTEYIDIIEIIVLERAKGGRDKYVSTQW